MSNSHRTKEQEEDDVINLALKLIQERKSRSPEEPKKTNSSHPRGEPPGKKSRSTEKDSRDSARRPPASKAAEKENLFKPPVRGNSKSPSRVRVRTTLGDKLPGQKEKRPFPEPRKRKEPIRPVTKVLRKPTSEEIEKRRDDIKSQNKAPEKPGVAQKNLHQELHLSSSSSSSSDEDEDAVTSKTPPLPPAEKPSKLLHTRSPLEGFQDEEVINALGQRSPLTRELFVNQYLVWRHTILQGGSPLISQNMFK